MIPLPHHLWSYLTSRTIELELHLEGQSARGIWPTVHITLDDHLVYHDLCVGHTVITDRRECRERFTIEIGLTNKKDHDTVVDAQGNILENQQIMIQSLILNGVDLIATGLVYRNIGGYQLDITPYKRQQLEKYKQNNDQTHNLIMTENGSWKLSLEQPLYTFFAQRWHLQEPIKNIVKDSRIIRVEMADKIKHCLRLESDRGKNKH